MSLVQNLDYYLLDINTNFYLGPDPSNTYVTEQITPNTFQFQQNKDGTFSITSGKYYTNVDTTNFAWNLIPISTNQTYFNLSITGNVITKITLASDNTKYLTLIGNGNYTPYFSNTGTPIMLRFLSVITQPDVWLLTAKAVSSKLSVDYHSTICSGQDKSWDCFKQTQNLTGCTTGDCNVNDVVLGTVDCPSPSMIKDNRKKSYWYMIIPIVIILILFIILNK